MSAPGAAGRENHLLATRGEKERALDRILVGHADIRQPKQRRGASAEAGRVGDNAEPLHCHGA
jgi:hypothetical protein